MLATTCLDNRIYVFRQNMSLSSPKRAKEWISSRYGSKYACGAYSVIILSELLISSSCIFFYIFHSASHTTIIREGG